jgi:hypothetical protein
MCRLMRDYDEYDSRGSWCDAANGTKPTSPVADDGRVGAADEELARQPAEGARRRVRI